MFQKNWYQIRQGVYGLMLALILIFSGMNGVQAQGGGTELFGEGGAYDLRAKPLEPHVMRARYVTVNTGLLFAKDGKPLEKSSLSEITLNLFDDATYIGRVSRTWRDRWGVYWQGSLSGVSDGYFYLTLADGAFMAHVASPKGIFEVAYTPEGVYRAIQIDQSKFEDHDPSASYEPSGKVIPEGSLGSSADSAARIDILIAYTDDARVAAGGTAAMKAIILTALNETNAAYANSGVTTRLRLVHVQEYAYAETGNMGTDLSRFRGSGDGYFDNIHSLRNQFGADMLGLIVENGGAYCGLASTIMATAATAFQVTDRDCATGYYSFGHEFAHLQGARHDTYVDTNNTPYSYGHGYVHTGATDYNRWRSIMAYNNRCTSLGYSCTRIQYFSNPAKTYHGAPEGVANTKNYLVLNNTDYTVANFRRQRITNNFNSSFNGSAAGWTPVTGSWTIFRSALYRSAGLANNGASAKRAGMFGDVTFEVRMRRTGNCTTCANRIIIRGRPNSLFSSNWWKPAYYFQYTNAGEFSIYEATNASTTVALKGWTAHPSIVQGGWNTLKVVAVGRRMKFYINGTLLWTANDPTLRVGQLGFGYYRDARAGVFLVNWARGTTTPTADPNLFEEVVPGVEIGGGTIDRSR